MDRPGKPEMMWHKQEKIQVYTTVSKDIWNKYQEIENKTGVKKCEQLFNDLINNGRK